MIRTINNEFYKFFKNKKNIIVIAVFFIYLVGTIFYNENKSKTYMKEEAQSYMIKASQADSIFSSKTLLLNNYEDLSDREKENIKKETLEREKEFYNIERNKLLVISDTYKNDNKEKYENLLISENDRYNNIIRGLDERIISQGFFVQHCPL